MIKAGQIYKVRGAKGLFVVSAKGSYDYHAIESDGKVNYFPEKFFEWSECILVAEYPTWQEAVNSKEFKGEDK